MKLSLGSPRPSDPLSLLPFIYRALKPLGSIVPNLAQKALKGMLSSQEPVSVMPPSFDPVLPHASGFKNRIKILPTIYVKPEKNWPLGFLLPTDFSKPPAPIKDWPVGFPLPIDLPKPPLPIKDWPVGFPLPIDLPKPLVAIKVIEAAPAVTQTATESILGGILGLFPVFLLCLYRSKEKIARVVNLVIPVSEEKKTYQLTFGSDSLEFNVSFSVGGIGKKIEFPDEGVYSRVYSQKSSERIFPADYSVWGPLQNFVWRREDNHTIVNVILRGNGLEEASPVSLPISDRERINFTVEGSNVNEVIDEESDWDGKDVLSLETVDPDNTDLELALPFSQNQNGYLKLYRS